MKIKSVRIRNYRCFVDETIQFDNYNTFVGPNGAGKSTVLMALNVFFRNTQAPSDVVNLSDEDFHNKDTATPVQITVTFCDLSEDAKRDLKAYVRQDELVVTAKASWNEIAHSAEVMQVGVRQVIKDFARYFEAYEAGAKAPDLKAIFQVIQKKHAGLPQETTKDGMRDALRTFEEAHFELCESIESSNQFYGWSRGSNLLGAHCQWVYLPAIKDPTEEQDEQRNTALGRLLERSIRTKVDFAGAINSLQVDASTRYREMLEAQNHHLKELGTTIQTRLREWTHPGARVELNWHYDENKSVSIADPFARVRVGEGDFLGEVVRSGHGMQRSFLIALLQMQVELDQETKPTLLLGFEEPELYQHPPQAKHLASLLDALSRTNTQVILTTHSPYFVSSKGYESIRLVRSSTSKGGSSISQVTYSQLCVALGKALGSDPQAPTELMAAVEQIMQPSQNELFFCKVPVLVEGPEDVAFISTLIHWLNKWGDFRRLGCHFVVCAGKTNLSRPLAVAEGLKLPTFVIFDADSDSAEQAEQERDNQCILSLIGSNASPSPTSPVFENRLVMWHTRIFDVVRADVTPAVWDKAELEARKVHKLQAGVRQKNPILITATVEHLLKAGTDFPAINRVVELLLSHATQTSK